MTKVKAFSCSEITCWFWSNDHRPPHFHAKRDGEWEVNVNFLNDKNDMLELLWASASGPSKAHRNYLTSKSEKYRAELLKEWEDVRNSQGS